MTFASRFFILFWAVLAGTAFPVLAQTAPPAKRVGYIVWSNPGERSHLEQSLLDGLRDQGYVEGKNLVVERRYVERGGIEQVDVAARELAALKLDAVVATCSPTTSAVRQATAGSGVPIVMAVVSDPVGQGLIASYQKPGGNITGLSSQGEDTLPKMLQYLVEVLPSDTRIAVLYNTRNPVHSRLWQELSRSAAPRGAKLVRIDVGGRSDFDAAFEAIGRERAAALLVLPDDNMTFNARVQLLSLVQKHRLPAMFGAREFVDGGGLMSYGLSYAASYRQAASYVDKVFTGAKPANLPVQQPTRFELVVNLAAATSLGIAIPPSLQARADDIIR